VSAGERPRVRSVPVVSSRAPVLSPSENLRNCTALYSTLSGLREGCRPPNVTVVRTTRRAARLPGHPRGRSEPVARVGEHPDVRVGSVPAVSLGHHPTAGSVPVVSAGERPRVKSVPVVSAGEHPRPRSVPVVSAQLTAPAAGPPARGRSDSRGVQRHTAETCHAHTHARHTAGGRGRGRMPRHARTRLTAVSIGFARGG